MTQVWKARWRMIAGALAVLVGFCLFAPIGAIAQSPWGKDYWPNLTFTTHEGKQVKLYDDLFKGKIIVVNFMFANCGDVCPLDTAQLKRVQEIVGDRVGKDIFFYSFSVDPENDTPKALREFMSRYDIKPGWTFLTGRKEDVTALQVKLGLEPAGDNARAHSTTIYLANEKYGQWIKRSPYENPQMLANLLTGKLDPGAPRSASASSRGYEEAVAVPTHAGANLFRTRCAACHTIGGGDTLGPDLLMVSSRRSPEWLARFIKEPDKVLAEKDPVALAMKAQFRDLAMPNLQLNDKNVAELIAFMDAENILAMEAKAAAEHAGHAPGHDGGHGGHGDHAGH